MSNSQDCLDKFVCLSQRDLLTGKVSHNLQVTPLLMKDSKQEIQINETLNAFRVEWSKPRRDGTNEGLLLLHEWRVVLSKPRGGVAKCHITCCCPPLAPPRPSSQLAEHFLSETVCASIIWSPTSCRASKEIVLIHRLLQTNREEKAPAEVESCSFGP